MRTVRVAAGALFNPQGQVLLARRPEGASLAGLWEFPGGKIEAGETAHAALVRELEEELGIRIEAPRWLADVHHTYADFQLHMQLFAVTAWVGTPQGLQGQALQWTAVDALAETPMPPADYPLIPAIRIFTASNVSSG